MAQSPHVSVSFTAKDSLPLSSVQHMVSYYDTLLNGSSGQRHAALIYTLLLLPNQDSEEQQRGNIEHWNLSVDIDQQHDFVVVNKNSTTEGVPCIKGDLVLGIGAHPLCAPHALSTMFKVHPMCCHGAHALSFLKCLQQPVAVHFVRILKDVVLPSSSFLVPKDSDVVLDTRFCGNVSRYLMTATPAGEKGGQSGQDRQGEETGDGKGKEEQEESNGDNQVNLRYQAVHAAWHDPGVSVPLLVLVAARDIQKGEALVAPSLPRVSPTTKSSGVERSV